MDEMLLFCLPYWNIYFLSLFTVYIEWKQAPVMEYDF